jgi:hypothetical protein
MTVETLKDCTKKTLARLAKDKGISGWHAMRKDQLIRALAPTGNGSKARAMVAAGAKPKPRPRVEGKKKPVPASNPTTQDQAVVPTPARVLDHGCVKDRIISVVRDPYWLHTHWELSRSTLLRAQTAMGNDWHTAKPILRLMDVTSEETTASSEKWVRDIEIHGGVNNWYIDITTPARSYRVDVGYLSRRGKFYILARSNVVCMPKSGGAGMLDENWSNIDEQYQRNGQRGNDGHIARDLQDLFEERLRRPMNGFSLTTLGTGALPSPNRKFHFEINAELIVFGTTEPNAKVTLQGEPVKLRSDGSFSVRFSLPDSRQIIPAVSSSPDGVEERTIVLAVERNTKELEPMIHDGNEL